MKPTIIFIAAVLLLGNDCVVETGVVDNGFIEGLEMPLSWPVGVGYDDSVIEEDLEGAVVESIDWWNGQLGEEMLVLSSEEDARVLVTVNGLPLTGADVFDVEDELELTEIDFDRVTGLILHSQVTLNVDLAYDYSSMVLGISHGGIGHGVFGLADDPGPPETVELRSIMAKPSDPLGRLTEHDRALILGE